MLRTNGLSPFFNLALSHPDPRRMATFLRRWANGLAPTLGQETGIQTDEEKPPTPSIPLTSLSIDSKEQVIASQKTNEQWIVIVEETNSSRVDATHPPDLARHATGPMTNEKANGLVTTLVEQLKTKPPSPNHHYIVYSTLLSPSDSSFSSLSTPSHLHWISF